MKTLENILEQLEKLEYSDEVYNAKQQNLFNVALYLYMRWGKDYPKEINIDKLSDIIGSYGTLANENINDEVFELWGVE